MRAVVWRGPSAVQLDEVPEPVPGPGSVVVDVDRAGICGSDVAAYRGTMGTARPGAVRGHELSGVVSAVGDPGDAAWVGVRVAVDPQTGCGTCWACTAGRGQPLRGPADPRGAPAGRFRRAGPRPGGQPGGGPGRADRRNGPRRPNPWRRRCHDVRLVAAAAPQDCLVVGAGSIGHLLVQAARLSGIPPRSRWSTPTAARRRAAEDVGAAAAVGSADEAAALAARLPRARVRRRLRRGRQRGHPRGRGRAGAPGRLRSCWWGCTPTSPRCPGSRWSGTRSRCSGANCFERSDFAAGRGVAGGGPVIGSPRRCGTATLEEAPGVFADLAAGSRGGRQDLPGACPLHDRLPAVARISPRRTTCHALLSDQTVMVLHWKCTMRCSTFRRRSSQ